MEFNHNYVNNDLQYEIYPLYDNSGICDLSREKGTRSILEYIKSLLER